jgi:hypothetical protein
MGYDWVNVKGIEGNLGGIKKQVHDVPNGTTFQTLTTSNPYGTGDSAL